MLRFHRFLSLLLVLSGLLRPVSFSSETVETGAFGAPAGLSVAAPSAVLMEKSTGTVLYEKNAHEHFPPASVTKVMTLLLIAEDLESGKIRLTDTVTASRRAASFGGSCVFLEEGEQMSVSDMLKANLCDEYAEFLGEITNYELRITNEGKEEDHVESEN